MFEMFGSLKDDFRSIETVIISLGLFQRSVQRFFPPPNHEKCKKRQDEVFIPDISSPYRVETDVRVLRIGSFRSHGATQKSKKKKKRS